MFSVGDLFTTHYPGYEGPYKVVRITDSGASPILSTRCGNAFFSRMCDRVDEENLYTPEDWS